MGVADRGEDDHVGTDDPLQTLHLARFRDSGLEDRQLLVALKHQHRERHTQLRIVALRRTVVLHAGGKLLGDPLLDDRLAVRAGDADHRAPELRPVVGRQALQGVDGIRDHDAAAIRRQIDRPFGQKGADPAVEHLSDIVVRIVIGAAHRHEHRARSQLAGQRTAVRHDRLHLAVRARKRAAHDGGNP